MLVAEVWPNEANPVGKTGRAPAEVCVVRAGSLFAGVPIARIAEIVGAVRPRPLPHAPWFVGGLVLYRGEVLTAVDLRRLLDVESGSTDPEPTGFERGRSCSMLVIESAGGAFGLLVDSVDEVLTVCGEDYEPTPSILNARYRELFDGAYKLEGRLLVMLNPERLDPGYLGGFLDGFLSGFPGTASLTAMRQTGAGKSVPAGPAEGEG